MRELVHRHVPLFRKRYDLAGDVMRFSEGNAFADEVVC